MPTVALILAVVGPVPNLPTQLSAAAKQYYAAMPAIAPVTGTDTASDYYARLVEDGTLFPIGAAPDGYSQADYERLVETIASLDLDLANQLLHRTYAPMSTQPGLREVFVKSSADGTMQPAAVYVPANYDVRKASPLVVFLHGRPQSESELLAPRFVEDLADATGTIIVAPYGRAYYDFRKAASQDVYDALNAAVHTFNIDPRKKFLAGYSMGGFSVFEVQAIHPDAWSAVMCISGGLLGPDAARAVTALRTTPLYVLAGDNDTSIDPKYTTASAAYLARAGIEVGFYHRRSGTHRLVTLLPILKSAWDDMHQGVMHQMAIENAPALNLHATIEEPTVKN